MFERGVKQNKERHDKKYIRLELGMDEIKIIFKRAD